MSVVEVLKFGSSVLRSDRDLHVARDEIYRRWRMGHRILAIVSAFDGVTDELMAEVENSTATACEEATAAYVATGEQKTAALLLGVLLNSGIPSRLIDPRDVRLLAEGTSLESTPIHVDVAELQAAWAEHPILVLPGFQGIDRNGRVVLFGRGGSDVSAVFVAAALRANCRLLKDVAGVFDADPAKNPFAHRFSSLSWETAATFAGPLIQPKALRFAQQHAVTFEVGRPNDSISTRVGHHRDELAPPERASRPLGIALVGCGTVGRGVYELVKGYPGTCALRHVVVRDIARYGDIEHLSTDSSVIFDAKVDVVIVCTTADTGADSLIVAALNAKKFVITANKAAVAARGAEFGEYLWGAKRRLWCSAAVGGVLPILEILRTLNAPVREIRGIVNGTCGVVLDAWLAGKTLPEAIAAAQSAGFAETNPERDLSGYDSADKLALMIQAAFGQALAVEDIPVRGIDSIDDPSGYKLIARATRNGRVVNASVAPERLPPNSFLGSARGPENRLEIELVSGDIIELRGQGAGRWPTAVSIMGDLHEIARQFQTAVNGGVTGAE